MNIIYFRPENIVEAPITEGDCGVIFRANGEFQPFSTGSIDPNNLTDRQLEQGKLLTALLITLNTPRLREAFIGLSEDPGLLASLERGVTSH